MTGDDVVVDRLDGEPVVVEESLTSDERRRRLVLAGAAASALVGLLVLLLTGSTDEGAEGSRATTAPAGGSEREPAADTTSADIEAQPVVPPRQEGEPLLGREIGYSLLVSVGNQIQVVDLDRSAVTTLSAQGDLGLVAGDHLVVRHANVWSSVPLAGSEADTITLYERKQVEPFDGYLRQSPDSSSVWLRGYSDPASSVWRRFDLASGAVLEESSATGYRMPPWLATSAAGGLWAVDDDGYRPVSSGTLVAESSELVVVRECSSPGQCDLVAYELSTLRQVELSALDDALPSDLRFHGTRLLEYATPNGRVVWDLHRDTRFDEPDHVLVTTPWYTLSPDERYVAPVGGGHTRAIYDLDTGESWDLSALLGPTAHRLLFVENEALFGSDGVD